MKGAKQRRAKRRAKREDDATVHRIAVNGLMVCAVRPSMMVIWVGWCGGWWYGWMIGGKTEDERGACGVPLLNGVCSGGGRRRSGVCEGRPEGAGGGDHPPKILIGGTRTYKISAKPFTCVCVTIGLFVTLGQISGQISGQKCTLVVFNCPL